MFKELNPDKKPINVNAMYSPADAWSPKLVTAAANGDIPTFFAWIPKVKATAKYPNAMGIPALTPFAKQFNWLSFIFLISRIFLFYQLYKFFLILLTL